MTMKTWNAGELVNHADLNSNFAQLATPTTTGGTTARALADHLRLDVKDFGAKGDGVTNDAPAFQAAVNYLMAAFGGELVIPAGSYALSTAITISVTNTAYQSTRIRIRGAGGQSSYLICAGGGFTYAGTGSGNAHQSMLDIDGVNLYGPLTVGSIGISINNAAYVKTTDLVIENFDTAISAIDLEVSDFGPNTRLRYNNMGFTAAHGTITGINSIAFRSATIGNNYVYGALITTGVNLLLDNADIQYNGPSSQVTTSWGLKLVNFGLTNGIGVVAVNAYFEGNGGAADVWIDNTASGPISVNTFTGTLFMKTSATKYVKNPILVTGTQSTVVNLVGCSFAYVSPYTPAAGNQYYSVTNSGAGSGVYNVAGTTLFESATETPGTFSAPTLAVGSGGLGAGVTVPQPNQLATVHVGTNANFGVGLPVSVAGAIAISGLNDAGNAAAPLEYRATSHTFATGSCAFWQPVYIQAQPAPATPATGLFSIYVDSADSKMKVKGPSGTVTILAVA